MSKYLGIDASTQSLTGMLIDTCTASIMLEVTVNFDAEFGCRYGVTHGVMDLGAGVVHSPPLMWVDALDLLLHRLQAQGVDLGGIVAVAGSGQQHGTVHLNAEADTALGGLQPDHPLAAQLQCVFSRPTAPVWMDTSTTIQCREIEAAVGGRQRLLEITGNTAFERFSGPQIRKFHQTEPDAYAATRHICLVSSFMASVLAGKVVGVDPGDGSGTNLMDIGTRTWSPEALAATAPDLGQRLAPVTPATRVAGTVSAYFVQRYGFSPECLVLPFSGDNPCSLLGLGLVRSGQAALSLGTSDTLFACMDDPRFSTTGEGALFASPDDIHYMALICFLNGSLARDAVRKRFGLSWEEFGAALAQTPPGNHGALMLPYFAPEIVPHVPRASVVRRGLAEDDVAGNVRAVIEAQALSSKIHSRWMGLDFSVLHVTGGASANTSILQVFADVHGCPVQRFNTTNAAALGAALRACHGERALRGRTPTWEEVVGPFTRPVAGSTIHPDASCAEIYADLAQEYSQVERRYAGKRCVEERPCC